MHKSNYIPSVIRRKREKSQALFCRRIQLQETIKNQVIREGRWEFLPTDPIIARKVSNSYEPDSILITKVCLPKDGHLHFTHEGVYHEFDFSYNFPLWNYVDGKPIRVLFHRENPRIIYLHRMFQQRRIAVLSEDDNLDNFHIKLELLSIDTDV